MVGVEIRIVDWARYSEALSSLRHTVFVEEQGVPVELELDGEDAAAWHAAAGDVDAAEREDGCATGLAPVAHAVAGRRGGLHAPRHDLRLTGRLPGWHALLREGGERRGTRNSERYANHLNRIASV